jgi:hypothetical protein
MSFATVNEALRLREQIEAAFRVPLTEANVRLIIAAPKLLAFVQGFVLASDAMAREWSQGDWRAVLKLVRDLTEEARALIAKAEGRS